MLAFSTLDMKISTRFSNDFQERRQISSRFSMIFKKFARIFSDFVENAEKRCNLSKFIDFNLIFVMILPDIFFQFSTEGSIQFSPSRPPFGPSADEASSDGRRESESLPPGLPLPLSSRRTSAEGGRSGSQSIKLVLNVQVFNK